MPKKQIKSTPVVDTALPTTPLTNQSTPPPTMDSDDDFMSGVSSQEEDFGGTQDSDNYSLGEGTSRIMNNKLKAGLVASWR